MSPKEKSSSSLKRLSVSSLAAGLLLISVFAILPRILPYERLNKFYAILQGAEKQPVDTLQMDRDQEVWLLVDRMLTIPETWLIVNGQKAVQIEKDQIDGNRSVIIPAFFLREPGTIRLSIELVYPFLTIPTNQITVFVEAEEAIT